MQTRMQHAAPRSAALQSSTTLSYQNPVYAPSRQVTCLATAALGGSDGSGSSRRRRKTRERTAASAPPPDAELVVGIDLGTTNSAVAFVREDGRPVCVPNALGDTLTPSVVHFAPGGRGLWVVQHAAVTAQRRIFLSSASLGAHGTTQ